MLHPDTEQQALLSFVRERGEQARKASVTSTRQHFRLLVFGGDLLISIGTMMKKRAYPGSLNHMPGGIVEVK